MNIIATRKLATGLLAGAASLALVAGTGLAQTTGTTGTTGGNQTGTTATGQMGTTRDATTVGMLDKEEIRAMLEEQGYSEIENLKEDGLAWTATATRDGEKVELRIERMWRAVATDRNLDEERVKTMLENEGYSSVGDIQEDGGMWSAEARRDGESVKVHVNAERQVVVSERTSG